MPRPHLDERSGKPARVITGYIYRQLTQAEQVLYRKDPASERYAYCHPIDGVLEVRQELFNPFEPTADERERAHSVNAMTAPAPAPLHRNHKGKVPIVPRSPRGL